MMKRTIGSRPARTALAIFSVVLLLAPAVAGRTTAGQTAASNWVVPFQGSLLVGTGDQAEWVDLTGSVHLVVNVTAPVDPCASCVPPNPVRIHTNLITVSGVGRTTGASYRAAGAANFEMEVDAESSFEFAGSYRLAPTDPCRGCPAGALFLPIRYSVTLNAAGEVTEAAASVGGGIVIDSE